MEYAVHESTWNQSDKKKNAKVSSQSYMTKVKQEKIYVVGFVDPRRYQSSHSLYFPYFPLSQHT